MTALWLEHVTVRLGAVMAVDDVSLSMESGSRLAVVGASGSGKSTLLRAVAGLGRIDGGVIRIGDRTVADTRTMIAAHRRGVGYVPQDGALFPHLTVERNIRFGLPRGAAGTARARETAELVGLDAPLLGRYPHELSGGQQQRVALARALAVRPTMIVLDEPFSALDTALRERARRAVIDVLDATGVTAVLVTHDQDEALTFGDAIGILDAGRLVQSGASQDVFDRPATPEIAAFLGDACFLAAEISDEAAITAVGTVALRARFADAGAPRVLLRPSQFAIDDSADAAAAEVRGIERRGPLVRLTLRVSRSGDELVFDVPAAAHPGITAGDVLGIRITGTGVAYA